jgi:hypothetical protein
MKGLLLKEYIKEVLQKTPNDIKEIEFDIAFGIDENHMPYIDGSGIQRVKFKVKRK